MSNVENATSIDLDGNNLRVSGREMMYVIEQKRLSTFSHGENVKVGERQRELKKKKRRRIKHHDTILLLLFLSATDPMRLLTKTSQRHAESVRYI